MLDNVNRKERLAKLREQFIENQDGVLESIADEYGVSLRNVLQSMPDHCQRAIDGYAFEQVMADLSTWGDVTFLVHTKDIILESKACVPAGKVVGEFFNFEGHTAIGGHLRYKHCQSIHFLKRPFMKMATCAILFMNSEGEAMFKVYVGRDDQRRLLTDQVERFDHLRDRLLKTHSWKETDTYHDA
ncbi:heme utilization cystosolic carrier protein HutX [Thalassospira xiamenensis]|uniref:heme utilization cystosolic carrier protein HutX n=1 Tax=Thalassospira xiamenensis TaxID=220697 RepID=UPI0007A492EE|nr:heme utilization cystosolic carrier protein HutX [Thalassospira xiamenensis]KZB56356.1 heme utilization protein HuvX [Thalassospira xiamenensis]MCK2167198.1 heme utilization cystosolic carrier protein HutX [Thalassospira xiamenensis]